MGQTVSESWKIEEQPGFIHVTVIVVLNGGKAYKRDIQRRDKAYLVIGQGLIEYTFVEIRSGSSLPQAECPYFPFFTSP